MQHYTNSRNILHGVVNYSWASLVKRSHLGSRLKQHLSFLLQKKQKWVSVAPGEILSRNYDLPGGILSRKRPRHRHLSGFGITTYHIITGSHQKRGTVQQLRTVHPQMSQLCRIGNMNAKTICCYYLANMDKIAAKCTMAAVAAIKEPPAAVDHGRSCGDQRSKLGGHDQLKQLSKLTEYQW